MAWRYRFSMHGGKLFFAKKSRLLRLRRYFRSSGVEVTRLIKAGADFTKLRYWLSVSS